MRITYPHRNTTKCSLTWVTSSRKYDTMFCIIWWPHTGNKTYMGYPTQEIPHGCFSEFTLKEGQNDKMLVVPHEWIRTANIVQCHVSYRNNVLSSFASMTNLKNKNMLSRPMFKHVPASREYHLLSNQCVGTEVVC